MSSEGKRWWAYAAVALIVPAIYFAVVLPQAVGRPVADIDFQVPLLAAGLIGVLLGMIAKVILRTASNAGSPQGAARVDERDREIHRFGEYIGGIVLAAAMAVPFALVLLEADHFWIANAMYLALVLWALASSAAKLIAYRRGF